MLEWLKGLLGSNPVEPRRQGSPPTGPQHFGGSPKPLGFSAPPSMGPRLEQYPSMQDATQARQGGFGYGEPYSAYVEGQAGRIFGDKQGPVPMEGKTLLPRGATWPDLTKKVFGEAPTTQNRAPEDKDRLQELFTRGALAANRSPVAALGFNPRDMTFDVTGKTRYAYSGLTDPQTGKMMVQAGPNRAGDDDASTMVHESMHRGLLDLTNNPALAPELRLRLTDRTDEESLVRQLMMLQAGNPEGGNVAAQQRLEGEQWTPEEIAELDRAAQTMIKERRPRGPR